MTKFGKYQNYIIVFAAIFLIMYVFFKKYLLGFSLPIAIIGLTLAVYVYYKSYIERR